MTRFASTSFIRWTASAVAVALFVVIAETKPLAVAAAGPTAPISGPGASPGPGAPGPFGSGPGFTGRGFPSTQPSPGGGGGGGRGRGGGPGQPPRTPAAPLHPTDQQIDSAILILIETDHDLALRIIEARRSNPERVNAMIVEVWPKIAQTVELRERDPDAYQLAMRGIRLNRSVDEIVKQIKAAGDSPVAAQYRSALQDLLTERQKNRANMTAHTIESQKARMEKQIQEQRDRLEERRQGIEKAVDEEMRRLTGQGAKFPATQPTPVR